MEPAFNGYISLIYSRFEAFVQSPIEVANEETILKQIKHDTLCTGDAYTKAMWSRNWAKQGVISLTPTLSWCNRKYAKAYRHFIKTQTDMVQILKKRKTAIEPIFDLIAQLLSTNGKQKQICRQESKNVRTHYGFGVSSLRIAMITNQIWKMPFRTISHIKGVFA